MWSLQNKNVTFSDSDSEVYSQKEGDYASRLMGYYQPFCPGVNCIGLKDLERTTASKCCQIQGAVCSSDYVKPL